MSQRPELHRDDDTGSDTDEPEEERPVRRRKASRRRKKGGRSQTQYRAFGIGLAAVGIYTLVVLGLSLINSWAGILLILAGAAIAFAGSIWFFVIAFQEDSSEGLMCLFVPFYPLYYTITRFDTVWPTLAVQLVGVGMELLGILIIAWRGIFMMM